MDFVFDGGWAGRNPTLGGTEMLVVGLGCTVAEVEVSPGCHVRLTQSTDFPL